MLAAVELARKDANARPRNTMVKYKIITDRPAFLTNLLEGSRTHYVRQRSSLPREDLNYVRMCVQHAVGKLLRSGHCDHVQLSSWRGTEWDGWHSWPPDRLADFWRKSNAQTAMTMPDDIADAATHTQKFLVWVPALHRNKVDALDVYWDGGGAEEPR